MNIQINGRGAFLGAFAAIALGALTAAQLPSLQARSAGNGYLGMLNPGRELWRMTPDDQAANGPYIVPQGKELILCGMVARSGGGWFDATCLLDGEAVAGSTYTGVSGWYNGANGNGSTIWFPGLLAQEGQTVEITYFGTAQPQLFGYLRDL